MFGREADIPSVTIAGPVTLELDKIRRDSARSSKSGTSPPEGVGAETSRVGTGNRSQKLDSI